MPRGVRLCPACAGASGTHVCSARYLQPPPYVPRVSARHFLCPSLAFPTRFCHLCLRKVSRALPQHVISSSLPLASMCAVYNIPSRTHTACLLGSILAAPTVRAMRVCPPLLMSFSCLSYELLPSVSAQSLTRVAPARH